MRVIKHKILVNNSLSRFNGTVPGTIKIWRTPIGDYKSRKEAELAIMQTSYPLETITMDFTYEDIDVRNNGQGNYGLIPFNITESAITSDETSENTIPYSEVIGWYGFLKKHYEKIGEDGTAEKHYLLENGGDSVSQEDLREAIEEDAKVESIQKLFNGNDPIKWIEKNLLGKDNSNKTVEGIVSNSDDVYKRGYFTIPILITSNIDDMGQMSIFEDTFSTNDFYEENQTYDFRLGEIYNNPSYVDYNGNINTLDSAYVIYKFTPTSGNSIELSGTTDTGYSTYTDIYVGKTMSGNTLYSVYAMPYYDWCLKWNLMYDMNAAEMGSVDYINRSIDKVAYHEDGGLAPYDDTFSPEWYVVKSYKLEKPSEYGFFLIDGSIYPIKKNLFVTYNDSTSPMYGQEFPVYEVKKHNTSDALLYYTIINGKKYIAEMKRFDGQAQLLPCFYFKQSNVCEKDINDYAVVTSISEKSKRLYIEYEGSYAFLYEDDEILRLKGINTDYVEHSETKEYTRIMYYTDIDGTTYYILHHEIGFLTTLVDDTVIDDNYDYVISQTFERNMPEGCKYPEFNFKENVLRLTFQNKINYTSTVSGYTVSRLDMVRDMETSTDILGNQMPGVFDYEYDVDAEKDPDRKHRVNSKYNEPYDGILLEIPYHIGNTNEIEYVNNVPKGDILSELLIIPYDSDGNELVPNGIKNKFYADSGITIQDVYNRNLAKNVIERLFNIDNVISIKLKLKYQIGTELSVKEIKDDSNQLWLKLYYPKNTGDTISAGIVYYEEYTLVEKNCKYYTSENNCISLRYYSMESDIQRGYTNNDFEDSYQNEKQAIFTFAVNGLGIKNSYNVWSNILPGKNYKGEFKFDRFNGEMLSPVMRNDCMFGISEIQNQNNNIYVDRGINALFEKQMKLNEAKTLDALILYGNRWFKIDS